MASSASVGKESQEDEVFSSELPAPPAWRKKVRSKKRGTLRKNEIVFIAPTGEEINTKKQLVEYLKTHVGGPAISEFDWSSGETPRRSPRIREKVDPTSPPSNEPPKKRSRKSTGVNDSKAAVKETEEEKVVEMQDAEAAKKDSAETRVGDEDEDMRDVIQEGAVGEKKVKALDGADRRDNTEETTNEVVVNMEETVDPHVEANAEQIGVSEGEVEKHAIGKPQSVENIKETCGATEEAEKKKEVEMEERVVPEGEIVNHDDSTPPSVEEEVKEREEETEEIMVIPEKDEPHLNQGEEKKHDPVTPSLEEEVKDKSEEAQDDRKVELDEAEQEKNGAPQSVEEDSTPPSVEEEVKENKQEVSVGEETQNEKEEEREEIMVPEKDEPRLNQGEEKKHDPVSEEAQDDRKVELEEIKHEAEQEKNGASQSVEEEAKGTENEKEVEMPQGVVDHGEVEKHEMTNNASQSVEEHGNQIDSAQQQQPAPSPVSC